MATLITIEYTARYNGSWTIMELFEDKKDVRFTGDYKRESTAKAQITRRMNYRNRHSNELVLVFPDEMRQEIERRQTQPTPVVERVEVALPEDINEGLPPTDEERNEARRLVRETDAPTYVALLPDNTTCVLSHHQLHHDTLPDMPRVVIADRSITMKYIVYPARAPFFQASQEWIITMNEQKVYTDSDEQRARMRYESLASHYRGATVVLHEPTQPVEVVTTTLDNTITIARQAYLDAVEEEKRVIAEVARRVGDSSSYVNDEAYVERYSEIEDELHRYEVMVARQQAEQMLLDVSHERMKMHPLYNDIKPAFRVRGKLREKLLALIVETFVPSHAQKQIHTENKQIARNVLTTLLGDDTDLDFLDDEDVRVEIRVSDADEQEPHILSQQTMQQQHEHIASVSPLDELDRLRYENEQLAKERKEAIDALALSQEKITEHRAIIQKHIDKYQKLIDHANANIHESYSHGQTNVDSQRTVIERNQAKINALEALEDELD